jgi:anti-anti-sigma factor
VPEHTWPVQWTGRQAVVALPEHIDEFNAGRIRDQLISVVNSGAAILIADMTATVSCDRAGVDAVAGAYQRATANGSQLRLVVTAQAVRRALSTEGLDRMIALYSSLEAATAVPAGAMPAIHRPATTQAGDQPPAREADLGGRSGRPLAHNDGPGSAAITPELLWAVVDALADGVALTGDDGRLALVNRRVEDMFGYERAELLGQPVESLIPADLRASHRGHRTGYLQAPQARPMGDRARLVGLRKDGTTFPVQISLSPVPTATGHFTLTVIRDATQAHQHHDLAELARAAVASAQAHRSQELLDRVVSHLFQVGLSLQAASGQPADLARQRIGEAVQRLDDTIHDIRDHLFAARHRLPGLTDDLRPPAR